MKGSIDISRREVSTIDLDKREISYINFTELMKGTIDISRREVSTNQFTRINETIHISVVSVTIGLLTSPCVDVRHLVLEQRDTVLHPDDQRAVH